MRRTGCRSRGDQFEEEAVVNNDSFAAQVRAELRRVGLDPDLLHGLASQGDTAAWLERLRALPVGSSWTDVFPGTPEGWSPTVAEEDHTLGPFDYQAPPFGVVVYASMHGDNPVSAGEAAIAQARTLGFEIHGAGIITDRGAPHLYIVLPLEATPDDANTIADALRDRDGIGNAYPIIRGHHR